METAARENGSVFDTRFVCKLKMFYASAKDRISRSQPSKHSNVFIHYFVNKV